MSAVVLSGGKVLGGSSGIFNVGAGGGGATLVFSYPSGFAGSSGTISTPGSTVISGSAIELTGTAMHQAGGSWYKTATVNIQSFTTNFTFQCQSGETVPQIAGLAFGIQNSVSPPGASGWVGTNYVGDANLSGFGLYNPSVGGQNAATDVVAIKFDWSDGNNTGQFSPPGSSPNSTGVYINGGPNAILVAANDLNPFVIDFYSGHIMAVNMVYDGTLLTMVIVDQTTGAQGRYVWPINIPSWVGANTAYVGFTGGVGVNTQATQEILTWNYSTGYNTRLATPTFSVPAGQYPSTQSVTISGPAGASLYYTTNGLLPTSASTLVTGAISVSANTNLQVIAVQSGFTDSLVAQASYKIGTSNAINFPSGFAANDGVVVCGYGYLNGSAIQLTDTTGSNSFATAGTFQASSAWWSAPVTISTFSTTATLVFSGSNASGQYGVGTVFCIQNQPATADIPNPYGYVSGGPTAIANSNTALGYGSVTPGTGTGSTGGILNSIGVSFNLSDNGVGLYTNGAIPSGSDTTITGITLSSGHPITAAFSYSGTTLSLLLTDTVTLGTFSHSWTVDIPTEVGASTAYVGFTAASSYWYANQSVTAWTGF